MNLSISNSKLAHLIVVLSLCVLYSCKKNNTGSPRIETIAVTGITIDGAKSGGRIIDDGGLQITYSGICWSKANQVPTVADDTTKTDVKKGSFSSMLKNLTPSSTYYIRAYINTNNGVSYGNVVSFTMGNGAPVASSVSVKGSANSNELLTADYTYLDYEGDIEAGTSTQWYLATNSSGAGESIIAGATSKTFKLEDIHKGKFFRVSVTPRASAGTANGLEVKSAYVGPVGDSISLTFRYNGQEVTYGIITTKATGRKWLDRNLGALRAAQSPYDNLAGGDLFQWGRAADGHQLILRTSNGSTPVNGITAVQSSTDSPGTNKFILGTKGLYDWRIPQNSNLWQGVNGINNPCPPGWKIPSQEEWLAEKISASDYALLNLVITTGRYYDGEMGDWGHLLYWSSTVEPNPFDGHQEAWSVGFRAPPASNISRFTAKATAMACRCIKN